MSERPNLQHKEDGSFWTSGHPETPEEGNPFESLFDPDARCYFFRELKRGPWYWPFWKRTGKIWEGTRKDSPLPFNVIRRS